MARTKIIDGCIYQLDETKASEREARILAVLYRRKNDWKVRVLQGKIGYNIWRNLN